MQYGTKGEGRDGATGGLPNGGEGGQAAEAAAETTSAERDSRTLDYLITVIGFGLCRAWIVFSWARRSSQAQHHPSPGSYLLFGALSALTVSVRCKSKRQAPRASCASRCSAQLR